MANTPWLNITLSAGITAALATPLRKWLISGNRLDVPNQRSSHQQPVPRGGGIAALLGTAATLALTRSAIRPRMALTIGALGAVGWLDDVKGDVPASIRLVSQVVAGAVGLSRGVADAPLAAALTAGVVNTFNFMDGINGISGLTACIWGINSIAHSHSHPNDLNTIGALVAGAGLGFLPHNVPSARLFLGDVGSYAFGGAMAAGILSQPTAASRLKVASPLFLYTTDVATTIARRAANRETLTEAHRDHVYQRLTNLGYSHSTVAALHAGGATLLAMASHRPKGVLIAAALAGSALYLASPTLLPARHFEPSPEAAD